jgi:hypothetical protein
MVPERFGERREINRAPRAELDLKPLAISSMKPNDSPRRQPEPTRVELDESAAGLANLRPPIHRHARFEPRSIRGAALALWCRRPPAGPPLLPPPTAPPARGSPDRHAALATASAGYEPGPVEIVRACAASPSRPRAADRAFTHRCRKDTDVLREPGLQGQPTFTGGVVQLANFHIDQSAGSHGGGIWVDECHQVIIENARFDANRGLRRRLALRGVRRRGSCGILKITAAGGVTTLVGGGPPGSIDGTGTEASFNNPTGLTVDGREVTTAARSEDVDLYSFEKNRQLVTWTIVRDDFSMLHLFQLDRSARHVPKRSSLLQSGSWCDRRSEPRAKQIVDGGADLVL